MKAPADSESEVQPQDLALADSESEVRPQDLATPDSEIEVRPQDFRRLSRKKEIIDLKEKGRHVFFVFLYMYLYFNKYIVQCTRKELSPALANEGPVHYNYKMV